MSVSRRRQTMDEKHPPMEQAKQATKTTKRAGTSLRKKAVSDLTLDEVLERLAYAEKTIEKQKRKILELVNVVLRRPESAVRR